MEARSSFSTGSTSGQARPFRGRVAPGAETGAAFGIYEVELRGGAEMAADLDAWRALGQRSLVPTVFAEPELLLPAMQHLADGRQAVLLLVWQQGPAARMLRGLFPVIMPSLSLAPGEIQLWQPGLFGSAAPLIDRQHPEAAIDAALSFCASRGSRYGTFMLAQIAAEGPLTETLQSLSRSSRRRFESLPVLRGGEYVPLLTLTEAGRLRAGEHRLGGSGFTVEHARGALQIRDGTEIFLVIEALGAKARGTRAIVQDPGAATFIRTMARQLGRRRRCRVDIVRHQGEAPVAALVLDSAEATWARIATSAEAGPAGEWLVAHLAAAAATQGKKLLVVDDGSLSHDAAFHAGLKPLGLADLVVSTRPGGSPGSAAGHLKRRIDRGLRSIGSANQRRLHGLLRARLPRGATAG